MKWGTAIFVVATLLAASRVSPAQEEGARPLSPCKDWKAWQDVTSGKTSAKLHVTATCQFPTAGYTVELVPANGGVQDPPVYVLRKLVHQPEGTAAQVITNVPINYSVDASAEYKTVLIKPDRKRIPVGAAH
jgi:hypothetical protein